MQTGLGDDIDLDGRVTARVVDGTSVDLGDGHCDELKRISVVLLDEEQGQEEESGAGLWDGGG